MKLSNSVKWKEGEKKTLIMFGCRPGYISTHTSLIIGQQYLHCRMGLGKDRAVLFFQEKYRKKKSFRLCKMYKQLYNY